MKKILILLSFSILILNSSCQKKQNSRFESFKEINTYELKGVYQGRLKSLNPEISKYLNGSLNILIENNHFHANIRFSQGPNDSIHEQSLYEGERCPEKNDDLNGDNFIDLYEASKVIKGKLIPLDDDLSSQRMGSGIYPKSDTYGSYLWGRNVLLEDLISDLKDDDLNPFDDLIKLDKNEIFQLENLIIIIQGISKDIELPDTVFNGTNHNQHDTLPIACGIIKRISKTPGVIDNDFGSRGIPGNEAPNEDGAEFPEANENEGEDYGDLTSNLNEFLLVQ